MANVDSTYANSYPISQPPVVEGSQGPAWDESIMQTLTDASGHLSEQLVANALLGVLNGNPSWTVDFFKLLHRIEGQTCLEQFLKGVFRCLAQHYTTPEFCRILLELVPKCDCTMVGKCVVDDSLEFIHEARNQLTYEFYEQVLSSLCEEGIRILYQEKQEEQKKSGIHQVNRASIFLFLTNLLLLKTPNRALSNALSAAEKYEQPEELSTSFFIELYRCCMMVIRDNLRRDNGGESVEGRECVQRLIELLKCICLHCSNKSSILEEITVQIEVHRAQLAIYKDMFTQLMTIPEKKWFFAELQRLENTHRIATYPGQKLDLVVWEDRVRNLGR